jgi:wobble nucleotide-excising tRNase
MKKYRYFVSYAFVNGNVIGHGNIEILIDDPITDSNAIRRIQDFVKTRDPKVEQIIILYWRRFEDPE